MLSFLSLSTPPYITHSDIETAANEFLKKFNSDGTIPVDIESIVRYNMDKKIDLQDMSLEGFSTNDFSIIYIKAYDYRFNTKRARFTIAHEIGHCQLHQKYYRHYPESEKAWKKFQESRSKEYDFFEWHADTFAGMVLIPTIALKEKISPHKKKLENLLNTMKEETYIENAFNDIGSYFCDDFDVSEAAMAIRIKRSELLKYPKIK